MFGRDLKRGGFLAQNMAFFFFPKTNLLLYIYGSTTYLDATVVNVRCFHSKILILCFRELSSQKKNTEGSDGRTHLVSRAYDTDLLSSFLPCGSSPPEHVASAASRVGVHVDAVLHKHQISGFGLEDSETKTTCRHVCIRTRIIGHTRRPPSEPYVYDMFDRVRSVKARVLPKNQTPSVESEAQTICLAGLKDPTNSAAAVIGWNKLPPRSRRSVDIRRRPPILSC